MLKKLLSAALASLLVLTGCGNTEKKDDGKLDIVCTVFPVYDWTRQIVGDTQNVEITYLLGNGSDLHSFQPTADDMIKISDCDVFVYVGGTSDEWVKDALSNARNKDMIVIDLLDVLADDLKEEEIKEGMAEENDDGSEIEYDEHIWLSLNNAENCVGAICNRLSSADPDNAAAYCDNAAYYNTQLQFLDRSYHMLFDGKNAVMIFGDRFPFRYFTDDYGIDYYAAFTGCSADSDASFETIAFLAKKCDEVGADTVFAIEGSDCTIASAVIQNTADKSQKTAILDSAQSVTVKDINEGVTYLAIMQKNYDVLKEAFE